MKLSDYIIPNNMKSTIRVKRWITELYFENYSKTHQPAFGCVGLFLAVCIRPVL